MCAHTHYFCYYGFAKLTLYMFYHTFCKPKTCIQFFYSFLINQLRHLRPLSILISVSLCTLQWCSLPCVVFHPQKHLKAKDLEFLKQAAKTKYGQVSSVSLVCRWNATSVWCVCIIARLMKCLSENKSINQGDLHGKSI